MVFVSGLNINIDGLKEEDIPRNFSNLGFRSNFLSNFNIMFTPIVICSIMCIILKIAYLNSKSYVFKPRFKKYSIAFICEWFFTLVIFSTYNIIISLLIGIQNLGVLDPISLTISVLMSLLPITVLVLYTKFTKKYE